MDLSRDPGYKVELGTDHALAATDARNRARRIAVKIVPVCNLCDKGIICLDRFREPAYCDCQAGHDALISHYNGVLADYAEQLDQYATYKATGHPPLTEDEYITIAIAYDVECSNLEQAMSEWR